MSVRCLIFVVPLWFPGLLHAESAAQPCHAPRLDNGYFVPEQHMYAHESMLTYACDNKHKPVIENWWAKITCQNGNWSHKPQCIDQKACFAPTILNANYTKNQDGWYEEGYKIRITCDTGYEFKNNDATAVCTNGTWSSVPVCEKSTLACGEPPQIPHAVIIQGYQEVFAVDSEVQYKCKDGYTMGEAKNKKSIICISGNWTEGPTCRPSTNSGLNDRKPPFATRPSTNSGLNDRKPPFATRPSTNSGLNDSKPSFTTIDQCGSPPNVLDGLVVEESLRSLTYKCNSYYKLIGPDTVVCYSDGTWSEVPTCADRFCSVNTDKDPKLIPNGVTYIKYGDTVELECKDEHMFKNFSVARCTDGRLTVSRCCNRLQIRTNTC
ncbi:complement factor H-related protein 1-like isoform X2 [Larimichthys crocea]|uniref:complement factor H-related protein 1-like isoform X2 n=1 Tax=Larimichthys crocea TaxID=215358 RepID=UPI000F5DF886|nr:complement factor H-related protein 1-like isoform X2 [Larimichthys crocea]